MSINRWLVLAGLVAVSACDAAGPTALCSVPGDEWTGTPATLCAADFPTLPTAQPIEEEAE